MDIYTPSVPYGSCGLINIPVDTVCLGKNVPVVLVGVLVSSDSLIHSGLDDPDLDGPGEAIELYPELLRLDSEAVLLAQVVMIVKGLK